MLTRKKMAAKQKADGNTSSRPPLPLPCTRLVCLTPLCTCSFYHAEDFLAAELAALDDAADEAADEDASHVAQMERQRYVTLPCYYYTHCKAKGKGV